MKTNRAISFPDELTVMPEGIRLNEKDTSSATWKFDFEDTVNADPLAKGGCLKILRAYLNFANKSDPRAFRSMSELMLATSLTRPTIKKAIKIMERLGYMVPLFVTEGGATMYRLVNVRKELIDEHLVIARVSRAFARADQKKQYRKRHGVKETFPPTMPDSERNYPPKVKETFPNTVEEYRRDSCSEGRGVLVEGYSPSNDNPYADLPDEVPFDIPSSDTEADEVIAEILPYLGTVNSAVMGSLRRMLLAGELSPAFLTENFGGGNGA